MATDNECSAPLGPCEGPEEMRQMECQKKEELWKKDRGGLPADLWCPVSSYA